VFRSLIGGCLFGFPFFFDTRTHARPGGTEPKKNPSLVHWTLVHVEIKLYSTPEYMYSGYVMVRRLSDQDE